MEMAHVLFQWNFQEQKMSEQEHGNLKYVYIYLHLFALDCTQVDICTVFVLCIHRLMQWMI